MARVFITGDRQQSLLLRSSMEGWITADQPAHFVHGCMVDVDLQWFYENDPHEDCSPESTKTYDNYYAMKRSLHVNVNHFDTGFLS